MKTKKCIPHTPYQIIKTREKRNCADLINSDAGMRRDPAAREQRGETEATPSRRIEWVCKMIYKKIHYYLCQKLKKILQFVQKEKCQQQCQKTINQKNISDYPVLRQLRMPESSKFSSYQLFDWKIYGNQSGKHSIS